MKKVFLLGAMVCALGMMTACKGGTANNNEYEDTTLWLCCEEDNPSTLSLVHKQGKYAFMKINESDSIINNQWFEDARNYSHGLWAVKLNDKWGFVDTTGNIVIPIMFDSVLVLEEDGEVFSEYGLGYVYLKKGINGWSKGWACIDTTGTPVPEI